MDDDDLKLYFKLKWFGLVSLSVLQRKNESFCYSSHHLQNEIKNKYPLNKCNQCGWLKFIYIKVNDGFSGSFFFC